MFEWSRQGGLATAGLSHALYASKRTILDAFVEQELGAFRARFPPRRDTPFGRDAVVELGNQIKRTIQDVFLLFKCQRCRALQNSRS